MLECGVKNKDDNLHKLGTVLNVGEKEKRW